MGDKTKIEWAEATWNPLAAYSLETGKRGWFCTHASEGCRNCYAESLNLRLGNGLHYIAQNASKVRWELVNLEQPLSWTRPRMIFVNSMTDLFHKDVPESFIDQVFAAMALTYRMEWTEKRGNIREPRHIFQVLTKCADRMRDYMQRFTAHDWVKEWFDIPVVKAATKISYDRGDALPGNASIPVVQWCADGMPGLWLGVSAEDQENANKRIPELLKTPASVRFVSYEPALGPVDFEPYLAHLGGGSDYDILTGISWIIIGGESGPRARNFNLDWARSVVSQCQEAGVACFVKQLGALPVEDCNGNGCGRCQRPHTLDLVDRKGGDIEEFPPELKVREYPTVAHLNA